MGSDEKTVFFDEIGRCGPIEHQDDPCSLFQHSRVLYLFHDVILVQSSEMFFVSFVLGLFSAIDIIFIAIDQS